MRWRLLVYPDSGAGDGSIKVYRVITLNAETGRYEPDSGEWEVSIGTAEFPENFTVIDNMVGKTASGLTNFGTGAGHFIKIRPAGSGGSGQWLGAVALNTYASGGPGYYIYNYVEGHEMGANGVGGAGATFDPVYANAFPVQKRCEQVEGANTGDEEQLKYDNNPDSATYLQESWVNIGQNLTACPLPAPNWSDTGNFRCVQSDGSNTGEQEKEQRDIGVGSPTYDQLRWVSNGQNLVACPIPEPPEYVNTGFKAWTTLEEYYIDNGLATGNTKPNAPGDPNYVAPVYDPSACPLP